MLSLKRRIQIVLLIVICFVFAEIRIARDQWSAARSPNFLLIGNAKEADIRRVGVKLEQFRETMNVLLPTLKYDSPVPSTVIVFRDDKSFTPYKPLRADGKPSDWVAGYFTSRADANYIVLTTEREAKQTYQTIYHEYIHFVVDNSLGRANVPPWINEGLAEYYEQFEIKDDIRVSLGLFNENHLTTLQRTRLIPFDQFFRIDYPTLFSQGKHGANVFYAQAWAVMHYLVHGNDGINSKGLNDYLNAIRRGVKHDTAFESAFKTTTSQMEKDVEKYVRQQSFKGYQFTFNNKLLFNDAVKFVPFTNAMAAAYLGDLLKSDPKRAASAEGHLAEAIKNEPDNVFANSSMASLLISLRRFKEAKEHLDRIRRSPSADYLAHYRYAYLLSREAMTEGGWVTDYTNAQATEIRESLKRSIELNPNFVESYSLLAFISIVRNDRIDETYELTKRAAAMAPGHENLALDLAALETRRGNYAISRMAADRVLASTSEPHIRQRAQTVLQDLANHQQMAERAKRSGTEGVSLIDIFRKGTPDLSPELQREALERIERESITSVLRKVEPGERRVIGHLRSIECSGGRIRYSVQLADSVIMLTSKDFFAPKVTAFVDIGSIEIGCDTIKRDLYAVITYREELDSKSKTVGRVVSIEFVPEGFKMEQ